MILRGVCGSTSRRSGEPQSQQTSMNIAPHSCTKNSSGNFNMSYISDFCSVNKVAETPASLFFIRGIHKEPFFCKIWSKDLEDVEVKGVRRTINYEGKLTERAVTVGLTAFIQVFLFSQTHTHTHSSTLLKTLYLRTSGDLLTFL